MSKRSWKKFKAGFKEPKVKRKVLLLAVLVVLFILNLIWVQYDRDQRLNSMTENTGTVYTQGVLGV
ncbi:MAG: hypothetical protein ACI4TK_06100, partial [Agathobacter sp.]